MPGVELLRCVARAVLAKGLRGLLQEVPLAPLLAEVAGEALREYRERAHGRALRAEVEAVARQGAEEARRVAAEVAREVAAGRPPEVARALELYLTQLPAAVRRTLARPDDPTGTTLPAAVALDRPDQLADLLPRRPLRFAPGARPDCLRGEWELVELLGSGGFGEVWKGRHVASPALVSAFKFCLDPHAQEQLLRHEAAVLSQVQRHGKHPGIVPLEDFSLKGDTPWLRYEYVPGGDLFGVFAELKPLPVAARAARAAAVLRDLAAVVGHFHRLAPAVVHRDLKPANVLLDRGAVRVADFGIGNLAAAGVGSGTTPGASGMLTLGGTFTATYASPQQKRGAPPDPRDDVFALGVIGYQLLVADPTAERPGGRWKKRLLDAGAPAALLDALDACLDDDPAERPADAAAIVFAAPPPAPPAPAPEVRVAPVRVEVAPRRPAQPDARDLPPLPADVLDLEGRIAGLDAALVALEDGTHPALAANRAAVALVEAAERTERDRVGALRGAATGDWFAAVEAVVQANPDAPAAALLDAHPDAPAGEVLAAVDAVRRAEAARRAWEAVAAPAAAAARAEISRLEGERAAARAALASRHADDLRAVLRGWFGRAGGDGFPFTAWGPVEAALRARRYAFDTAGTALLRRAEAEYRTWRGEAEEAALGDSTEAGGWDACEAYLRTFPAGPRAAAVRERLATGLRAELLTDFENLRLRDRYLAHRTPGQVEADRAWANGFYTVGRLWICFTILAGAALGAGAALAIARPTTPPPEAFEATPTRVKWAAFENVLKGVVGGGLMGGLLLGLGGVSWTESRRGHTLNPAWMAKVCAAVGPLPRNVVRDLTHIRTRYWGRRALLI